MDTIINGREAKEQRRMERLIVLLEDWAQWMRGDKGVEGYPEESAVVRGAGLKLFDDLCHRVDMATNEAVDASINDLEPGQVAAINKRYLHAVWRFPRGNYEDLLQQAHENLMRKLIKKGIYFPDEL